ncbi:unnamed protein product [Linum trigynum]|uniref:Uncharacterized protein n=1 Tax=Linum trigynum TaxID=586398 RepID=A0AAV2E493_9ROSI
MEAMISPSKKLIPVVPAATTGKLKRGKIPVIRRLRLLGSGEDESPAVWLLPCWGGRCRREIERLSGAPRGGETTGRVAVRRGETTGRAAGGAARGDDRQTGRAARRGAGRRQAERRCGAGRRQADWQSGAGRGGRREAERIRDERRGQRRR